VGKTIKHPFENAKNTSYKNGDLGGWCMIAFPTLMNMYVPKTRDLALIVWKEKTMEGYVFPSQPQK
jgi:hypothetical protein